MSGHTTSEVSELLGLTPTQIRHFVRRSLVVPERGENGEYRFSFQDVVMLRTVKNLMESRVSSRRAVRALLNVRAGLEQGKTLAAVRIFADGSTVLVREDNQLWEAETGQTYFDFEQAAPALKVARIGHDDLMGRELATEVACDVSGDYRHLDQRRSSDECADPDLIVAREADCLGSDEWYNLGLDLEDANSPRSLDAYAKAIELDPHNADAHVNLGRLLQLRGDLERARQHYRQALDLAPTHQLALYNLGTVFDEQNELEVAADYYRRAPRVPDSHYNLARIFELNGDELSARRHMRSYRQLLGVD
ncbi:MAG: tetratricopeptide repeat protein [Pseudomonadales bacterium]